jgi:hypothetical protein
MANHFVFMGDSTTRGPFCAKVYMGVHGTVEGGVCDYLTEEGNRRYWDGTDMKMQWGHKFTHKVFEMGDSERNVSFSFLWLANNLTDTVTTLLSLTNPAPTHIVFNYGLYDSS